MKRQQGIRCAGTPRSVLYIWLPLGLLVLALVACGGFQVRVTPTAAPPPTDSSGPPTPSGATGMPSPTTEPTLGPPTQAPPTPVPITEPTESPQPSSGGGTLAPGQTARVIAGGGLNMRDVASAKGKLLGRVLQGATVTIVAGPSQAPSDNYTWWQIDNGAGQVGWVAAGTPEDPWLAPDKASGPAVGGGKLVNRAIKLGDRVQVTTRDNQLLSIRETPGKNAQLAARVLTGTQFTVRGGPTNQDGFVWWQLEGDKVSGWAAEGDGTDRWLTPVEP
jgi:Bacterial SH3 domain